MGRRPREGTWVAFKTSRAAWLCERLRRVGHLSLYLASPLTAQKKGDSSSREHSTSLSVRESILANRRPSSPKVSCVPHAKTPPPTCHGAMEECGRDRKWSVGIFPPLGSSGAGSGCRSRPVLCPSAQQEAQRKRHLCRPRSMQVGGRALALASRRATVPLQAGG